MGHSHCTKQMLGRVPGGGDEDEEEEDRTVIMMMTVVAAVAAMMMIKACRIKVQKNVSSLLCAQTGAHSLAQAQKCWDCRYAPPHWAQEGSFLSRGINGDFRTDSSI